MEADVEWILREEKLMVINEAFIAQLRRVFDLTRENMEEPPNDNEVDLNLFIAVVAEDEDYFQHQMKLIVRESVDKEQETFEDLIKRVLCIH